MNEKAKYILHLSISDNGTYVTDCIWNMGKLLDNSFIYERGLSKFININDLEETANWNLNGNRKKSKLSIINDKRAVYYVFD